MPNIRRNPGFRIPPQRPLLGTHSGIRRAPHCKPGGNPGCNKDIGIQPTPRPSGSTPDQPMRNRWSAVAPDGTGYILKIRPAPGIPFRWEQPPPDCRCNKCTARRPRRHRLLPEKMTCIRHPVPAATAPAGLPRQQMQRPSPQTAKAPSGNMTCTRHPVTTLFPTARRRDSAAANIPSVARCDGYPPSSPEASTHPRVPDNGRLFLTARRCGSVRRPAAYGGTRYPPAHAMSKCAPIAPSSTRYTRNRSKRNAFAPIVICHRQVSPPRYFFSAGSTWQAFDPS